MELRFLTKNPGKFRELSELIDSGKCNLLQDSTGIHELQTEDMNELVRDKVLTAFGRIRRPLIVDHIVKFHGDFDQDDSLVITESNYFDRLQFEAPLDILLRADAMRQPILFIGYSLADINMRYLFHKLWKIWIEAKISDARKKSHIFMSRPNPVDAEIFKKWGITPITDESAGPDGLVRFLQSIKTTV